MRLVVIGRSVKNYPTIVNSKIEGMCIRQNLPDAILKILLSCFLVSFTNRQAWSGMKLKSILCLKLLKIKKNTRGRSELLISICVNDCRTEQYIPQLSNNLNVAL